MERAGIALRTTVGLSVPPSQPVTATSTKPGAAVLLCDGASAVTPTVTACHVLRAGEAHLCRYVTLIASIQP